MDKTGKKLVVEHGWYGCETGCCGTAVVGVDSGREGLHTRLDFRFEHTTDDEARALAERFRLVPEWSDAEIEIGDLRCFDERTT